MVFLSQTSFLVVVQFMSVNWKIIGFFARLNLLFVLLSFFATCNISVMSGFNSCAAHSSREDMKSSLSLFILKKEMSVTGVRVSLFTVNMLMFDDVALPETKPVPVP